MQNLQIHSNIVPEDVTRAVQQRALTICAEAVSRSFGPNGSTACILTDVSKDGSHISTTHTKDGYTIIKNIKFMGAIEHSVQDMLTDLTRYIVKEVGDGTTSAIILCKTVFDELCNNEKLKLNSSADTLARFRAVIDEAKKRIMAKARPATMEDIYNIALIATNNNEEIAQTLLRIYEQYGMDVYIDVGISTTPENIVKEYDGMTLETGFSNPCFKNDASTGGAKIKNPRIYFFDDPIDTPEMLNYLDAILNHNIMRALEKDSVYEFIPTVILCKKISPDSSCFFSRIIKTMEANPGAIPLLIVSDIHQDGILEDIQIMSRGKFIKKYIDPEMQKYDIENGNAPTLENVADFCGYAEEVRSDPLKTQVIRPKGMFDEEGNYSKEYESMLQYLKDQITKAEQEQAGLDVIAGAKRRYNSFKGNMIDFLIGGIIQSDRDALKASVEDAVLSCRSAAVDGVGYGGSYMAYHALLDIKKDPNFTNELIVDIMLRAYKELVTILYSKSLKPEEISGIFTGTRTCPLNIRTNEYDHKVLASIKADVVILDTISKILAMMYTTNQYILQNPMLNRYPKGLYDDESVE